MRCSSRGHAKYCMLLQFRLQVRHREVGQDLAVAFVRARRQRRQLGITRVKNFCVRLDKCIVQLNNRMYQYMSQLFSSLIK